MDYQTFRPMTKPTQKRKKITRNNFAEHNYNYVNISQTTQPFRINTQNQLFSQRQNFQQPFSKTVNFHDYPQVSQDQSENYPFFQQNKKYIQQTEIDNKHLSIHLIICHQMTMTITNQIFLHHIHRNTICDNLDQVQHH